MRYRLATLVALAATLTASAQIPKTQFQPFGANKGNFYNSSIGVWADKLELDLDATRTAVVNSRLSPFAKRALSEQVQVSIEAVEGLQRVVRKGGTREQIKVAYTGVENRLAVLNRAAQTDIQAGPVLAAPLARVSYANQMLYAAMIAGDANPPPDQGRNFIARLAHGLDDQAGELRSTIDDQMADNRQLDQAVRTFTRAARRMDRNLDDGGNVQQARADFDGVTRSWGTVAAILGRIPNVPPPVRVQAARVDGIYRRLEGVMAGGVAPPGVVVPPIGIIPPKTAVIAVGAGQGGGPRVRIYHDLRSDAAFDFFAYDSNFRGGVKVAVADLNGDNTPDVVTAPGPGMPALIRVFDGRDMSLMLEFNGMDPARWQGGVNIAAADMGRSRRALVAVAPDVGGGPVVSVFDLVQGKMIDEYACFDGQHRGGLRLAYGDVDADGDADLIAVQGPCDHPPTVRMFNINRKKIGEMNVFDPSWRGGVWVAAADVNGNGRAEILAGMDAGDRAVVRMFDVVKQRSVGELTAFPAAFRGGVRVAARDVDGDGVLDIICTPGAGIRNSPLRVFSGRTGAPLGDLPTFAGFQGGAFVGSK
jgi:hypothetical protein